MADNKKKSVAKAYVQVVPTVDGIKDTLTKEFGGEVSSSFGDIFKGTLLSGAVLGTVKEIGGAILDIGKDAVEAAADVKAANAQFEQTFAGLESAAKAALRSVSNETGIATTRLQNGYTALYAFTKSVGGDSETALNIAQRALKAAADSAAYYDRSVEDATETLMSFVKGNYANDAALGIAATETTRNAKANELYAKSFKELSEAQKVDVLLSMVEAGNKASGALGQAAREADSWTNVTGELAESWKQLMATLGSPVLEGLMPLVQGIADALKGLTEQTSFDILNQGIADFHSGLDSAAESLTASAAEMNTTAALAQRYVERLRELERAGLDTAETQREYAQVVNLLNEIMPELGLTINEVTGRLEQNTWAIEQNIQSLRDQAVQQAKMAYYKSIIDEYTKAYEAQFAAEQQMIQLKTEEAELQEQLYMAEAMQHAANIRGDSDLTKRTERVIELTNALIANREEQVGLNGALEEASSALTEQEGRLAAAEAGYAELAGAVGTATTAVDEQREEVAELTKAYNDSILAARESIDSQVGLFDKLAKKSEMSGTEIVRNWENQRKAFAQYEENLLKAVELGLDETLVKQLSDGSQQSMLILNELVNSTKVDIDEINAAFGGLSEAKDSVAHAMTEISGVADVKLAELLEQTRQWGYDSGTGIAKGVLDSIPAVESAFDKLAKKGQGAYMHTMDQHSPSRVMRAKGQDSGMGAVLGVEDSIPEMEKAMTALARSGGDAYMQEQLAAAADSPAYAIGYGTMGAGTTHNNSVAYGGITINISTQAGQDAHDIADAVMEELTNRLGREGAVF